MATRNYQYGLRPPTFNHDLVSRQMYLAAAYQEKLVDIELARRAETDEVLRKHCPLLVVCEEELAEIDQRIDIAVAAMKSANKAARARLDHRDAQQNITTMRKEQRDLRATRREYREVAFADDKLQILLQAVNTKTKDAVRDARAKCGVYWGTYLLIEQAADASRKGAPPRHHQYRGNGRVGVQLQKGRSVEQVMECYDQQIRLQHTPQTEQRRSKKGTPLPMPGARRQAQQYTLWMRVGSEGRSPIWATWPLILHRPLPDGARVKTVTVSRRILAGKPRWSVILTLTGEEHVFNASAVATNRDERGDIAIDVGYRVLPSGRLRVAYLVDGHGREEEVCLPAGKMGQFKKVEDLQSIRDQRFNDARDRLKNWSVEHPTPDWLIETTQHIHAWRRQSRLSTLVRYWHDHRFDGDDGIMTEMLVWRAKEHHLWQYQENLRDQLLAWRRDLYRNLAADLAGRYHSVYVEKLDLGDLHDVRRPKDEQEVESPVRRAARMACLSSLFEILKNKCRVVTVPPEDTTRICHECGGTCCWDQARELKHTCEHCGETWDQDMNAAKNILARGLEAKKAQELLASQAGKGVTGDNGKPKRPSRSDRLRAARKRRPETSEGK